MFTIHKVWLEFCRTLFLQELETCCVAKNKEWKEDFG